MAVGRHAGLFHSLPDVDVELSAGIFVAVVECLQNLQ
jgi:hypothetical protein